MPDHTLFSAQTGDASSSAIEGRDAEFVTAFAYGTWDGATATFEVSDGVGDYIALSDATFTANGVSNIQLSPGSKLRCTISGAGGSTSLSATVNEARRKGFL